jgi:hypothetical protein
VIPTLTGTGSGLTSSESGLLIAFVAGTIGAAAATTFGRLSDSTNRRRETYAAAVQALYAWAEYPYRIRRRTSDTAEELSKLADRGHDLQEKIRWYETWISAECYWLGCMFSRVDLEIGQHIGPSASDAWRTPPITEANDMVLGGWGPADCSAEIKKFQGAVAWRFGIRRMIGWIPLSNRPDLSSFVDVQ